MQSCLKVLLCLVVLSIPCDARETLFVNVKVFDGEHLLPSTNVLVRDGKIVEVGDAAASDLADVVPGDGSTLLPGLIDCHVHAFFPGHLEQAAIFGVTTQLDMMAIPQMASMFRRQQQDGKANDRSDYYSAGAAVTVKGGHGTQFGFKVPTLEKAEDADAFVAARIDEGSDYIKIIYDDGGVYGFGKPTLTKEMMAAAIEATHSRGKMAVAHIGSREGARLAISLGIDGLVHGFADESMDDAFVDLAKEKGVFVVPTAAVIKSMKLPKTAYDFLAKDANLGPFMTQANTSALQLRFPGSDRFKLDYAHLNKAIGQLHAANVPILAGTDAQNPGTTYGVSLHHELELLVDAGLTPASALAAATSLPAKHFQLEDRGRVAPGLRADSGSCRR